MRQCVQDIFINLFIMKKTSIASLFVYFIIGTSCLFIYYFILRKLNFNTALFTSISSGILSSLFYFFFTEMFWRYKSRNNPDKSEIIDDKTNV